MIKMASTITNLSVGVCHYIEQVKAGLVEPLSTDPTLDRDPAELALRARLYDYFQTLDRHGSEARLMDKTSRSLGARKIVNDFITSDLASFDRVVFLSTIDTKISCNLYATIFDRVIEQGSPQEQDILLDACAPDPQNLSNKFWESEDLVENPFFLKLLTRPKLNRRHLSLYLIAWERYEIIEFLIDHHFGADYARMILMSFQLGHMPLVVKIMSLIDPSADDYFHLIKSSRLDISLESIKIYLPHLEMHHLEDLLLNIADDKIVIYILEHTQAQIRFGLSHMLVNMKPKNISRVVGLLSTRGNGLSQQQLELAADFQTGRF